MGHSCQSGHFDSVAAVRSPFFNLPKEDDSAIVLLNGQVEVLDAGSKSASSVSS